MTDMIGRAAKAIAKVHCEELEIAIELPELGDFMKARAALDSIEEPTPEMIEAWLMAIGKADISASDTAMKAIWRAMHAKMMGKKYG